MDANQIIVRRVYNGFVIDGYSPDTRFILTSKDIQVAKDANDLANQIRDWAMKSMELETSFVEGQEAEPT